MRYSNNIKNSRHESLNCSFLPMNPHSRKLITLRKQRYNMLCYVYLWVWFSFSFGMIVPGGDDYEKIIVFINGCTTFNSVWK